jgi:hypothetical protein
MRVFGKSQGGGRRKTARSQAPLLAVLSTLAGDHRAAIIDLSRSGARLAGPDLPPEGDELIFKAENAQALGRVIWATRNECGVSFDNAMSAVDVQRLRTAADLPEYYGEA